MSRHVLLGSGGFLGAGRLAPWQAVLRAHFAGVSRALFLPYALADHDAYVDFLRTSGFDAGIPHVGLHTFDDPVAAIAEAEAIAVGGGNTFRLVHALHELGLLEPIRARVAAGVPYMGVSAGTNVACPTMMTTNDMPIVQPRSFEALGLVPFQVNAHYMPGHAYVRSGDGFLEHRGETRDTRIAEFHELNETPVVGVREGGWLVCVDDEVRLDGAAARIFRRGEEPVDLEPGARVDGLLPGNTSL